MSSFVLWSVVGAVTSVLLALCTIYLAHRCRRLATQLRQQAEELATERRERIQLQTLIEDAPVLIWTTHPGGTLDYISKPPGREVSDEERGELTTQWLKLTHEADRDNIQLAWQDAVQKSSNFESVHRIQSLSGEYRWQYSQAHPQRNREGTITAWHGSTLDVHDLFELERKLRASDERYQTVVENLSEGLILANQEGHILFWNRAALDLHGFASMDECFATLPEYPQIYELTTLDGDIIPFEEWPMSRLLRHEEIQAAELQVRRLDTDWQGIFCYGGASVRDANDELLFFLTITEVTERKEAERLLSETLREKEEAVAQLDALFTAAPIGLAFIDPTLHFVRINQALAETNGLAVADHLGKHVSEVVPDLDGLHAIITTWQQMLENGAAIRNIEVSGRTAAEPGKERYWLESFFPVTMAGETIGIGITVLEITERKLAEQEIRRFNEELEKRVARRTEQLQAVNQELEAFAYSVSHDLRAPLRAIDGYTRILMEDYVSHLDSEAMRLGTIVCNEAERMGQLIDDLLAFSRLNRVALQTQAIDMAQLVQDVFDQLPKDNLATTFQLHPLPNAFGDLTTLRQVWQNLLINAIKFSSKRKEPIVEVGATQTEREVTYWVKDNGAGFSMRYADKLFGVFQRLHGAREFPGTGVGLAIVQRIVNRHGGRVWAEGEVNIGATFYFALPQKEDNAQNDRGPERT